MDPKAQDPSSTFTPQDQVEGPRNEQKRAMQQLRPAARESKTARHVENLKSPTPSKDKGVALTPKVPVSRGREPNRHSPPARNGQITRGRAASLPTPQSHQTSHARVRSLNATGGRADMVMSKLVPAENQVQRNAATSSQQSSKVESTISRNIVKGGSTQINKIFNTLPEARRRKEIQDLQCIRDLKLTSPYYDRMKIVNRHSDVCDEHLQKISEHQSYKRWKDNDKVRLLWIYSHDIQTVNVKTMDFKTGNQKRTAAAAVAKELEQSLVPDNALAYMFCQNSKKPELKLNDTVAILRGLMWLLSFTQESLTVRLEEKYNPQGISMYEDEHAEEALSDTLMEWLEDSNVGTVYLVVGAIDECYSDRTEVLDLIIKCCKRSAKVKWVITSDCDDIYSTYINYIKDNLGPNHLSFETIHLNERSEKGGNGKMGAKKEQGQWETAPGNDTKGTSQEMEHGREESTGVAERHQGKRKRGVSITIQEDYGLENLFEDVADSQARTREIFDRMIAANYRLAREVTSESMREDELEKQEVLGPAKSPSLEREKELKIAHGRTPPRTERPLSSPSKLRESTSGPQKGSRSVRGKLNVQNGSAKKGSSCVVQ